MAEILNSLGINLPVLIAQSISFLVLIVLIRVVLFGPMTDIMNQRRIKIDGDLDSAGKELEKSETLRAEYEKKLADIADESRRRVAQSIADAEAAAKRVKEKAEEEMAELTKRHEAKLLADRLEVRRELKNEVLDLAVEIANKALREQMTPQIQSTVVEAMIKELDNKHLN